MEDLYRMLDPKRTLFSFITDPALTDLGLLCRNLLLDRDRRADDQEWSTLAERSDQMWNEIEARLAEIVLDPPTTRVYGEGIPLCGRENSYVKEMADAGSRYHRLLRRLRDEGHRIVGTEAPDLLAESGELARLKMLGGRAAEEEAVISGRTMIEHFLLVWRGQFIADRINETLREGESGILFLSRSHSFADRLAEDIRILYPLRARSGT